MKFLILLMSLVLGGCASKPTMYVDGRYSEKKINDDMYLVSYHRNGFSKSQIAFEMLYLRCAEVSLKNGYRYFLVLNTDTKKEEMTLNFILTISKKVTYTNLIHFLPNPIPGKKNFDAEAIYSARIKKLNLRPGSDVGAAMR